LGQPMRPAAAPNAHPAGLIFASRLRDGKGTKARFEIPVTQSLLGGGKIPLVG